MRKWTQSWMVFLLALGSGATQDWPAEGRNTDERSFLGSLSGGWTSLSQRFSTPKPPSRSVQCGREGAVALIRETSPRGLLRLVKSGALLPTPELFRSHDEPGVYFSLLGLASGGRPLHFGRGDAKDAVILVLSLDSLNRDDYHANWGWHHGRRYPHSVGPKEIVGFCRDLGQTGHGNEIVFRKPVPVADLREIWVLPENRDRLLQFVRDARLDPPPGKSWEDWVVSRSVYPSASP